MYVVASGEEFHLSFRPPDHDTYSYFSHYRDSSASGPTVDHVSSSSNTSDYATPCGGPSQRVSFETAAVVTTTTLEMPVNNSVQLNATSPLYEEPVNFIQRLSTIPASQEEPISGWSPEHRQLSHPQMGTQIRHSLSSQLGWSLNLLYYRLNWSKFRLSSISVSQTLI